MHGNHHHRHQRTDLRGIMSITSLFAIGPFVPCSPLCKILNSPVMSICLVKQNDGTWVEKHQRFLFNVYKRFFIFLSRFFTFLTFFIFFFWNVFNIYEVTQTCVVAERTALTSIQLTTKSGAYSSATSLQDYKCRK